MYKKFIQFYFLPCGSISLSIVYLIWLKFGFFLDVGPENRTVNGAIRTWSLVSFLLSAILFFMNGILSLRPRFRFPYILILSLVFVLFIYLHAFPLYWWWWILSGDFYFLTISCLFIGFHFLLEIFTIGHIVKLYKQLD